eukprot:UN10166
MQRSIISTVMKKSLTYIWEYFLRTGEIHFYPLLIHKVALFVA